MSDDGDNRNDRKAALAAARQELNCALLDIGDAQKCHPSERRRFIQSAKTYMGQALIQLTYAETAK